MKIIVYLDEDQNGRSASLTEDSVDIKGSLYPRELKFLNTIMFDMKNLTRQTKE